MRPAGLIAAVSAFGAAAGVWLAVAHLYVFPSQESSALEQGGAARFYVAGGYNIVAVDVRGEHSWSDAHYAFVGPITKNRLLEQLLIVPPADRGP